MIDKSAFDESLIRYKKCTIEQFTIWPYTSMIKLNVKDMFGDGVDHDQTIHFATDGEWFLSECDAKVIYKHLIDASWDDDLPVDCVLYNNSVAMLVIDKSYIPINGYGTYCAIYEIGRKAKNENQEHL